MSKTLNDKDLESVSGGIYGDGSSELDKPIDAGKYKTEIAIDNKGNYQEQFNEETNGSFSFNIAQQPDIR